MSFSALDLTATLTRWRQRHAASGAIGIDFGTEKINLVQFARGAEPRVRAATAVAYRVDRRTTLDTPGEIAQLLTPAFKRGGFRGRRVVAALPPGWVTLRFLPYRRSAGLSDAECVVAALAEQGDIKLAESVIDYLPIRPKSEEQAERAALVALASREDVLRFLKQFAQAGLEVEALEVGPVAIKRLLGAVHDHGAGNKIMCVNFGTLASFVTVLWERDLLLDRDVDFGIQTVLKVLADALDVTPDEAGTMLSRYGIGPGATRASGEDIGVALLDIVKPAFIALAEQIRKMLVYTAAETRGGAIDRIYLLGSVARWRGVDSLLHELVDLPVETINPFYGFEVEARPQRRAQLEAMPGIAVSAGLALRGLCGDG